MRVEKKKKHLHIEFIVTSHNSAQDIDDHFARMNNSLL
jgi:hypothetical protein